ncbi:MAG: hypothetical protein ACRERC_04755 [Candidatus Binatia bacterium]
MSVLTRWLAPALLGAGIAITAGQALADRPACDTLAAAAVSLDAAQVAQDHGVTRARVEACARLIEQRDQHAARRADQQALRIERAALLQR